MYTLISTLGGHNDSINATQFSPNGTYLASGSEDGSLLIHPVGEWKPLLRFVDVSPITSLVWHPILGRLLFCGCRSGDVHVIRFSASGVRSCISQHQTAILTDVRTPARCPYLDRRNTRPDTLPGPSQQEELTCCRMWQRCVFG